MSDATRGPIYRIGNSLVDLIKKSSGRIVNIGSAASVIGKVDCDNLRAEKNFSQFQYHNSKTATLLFTKELARREPGTGHCLSVGLFFQNVRSLS